MTLLWPLGLVSLGSLVILVLIWRFSRPHQTFRVPSLIPFQALPEQPPRSWPHHFNLLFWLQVACLVLLALALAEPALMRMIPSLSPRRTIVVIDNSPRMRALTRRTSAFEQARQEAIRIIERASATEQFALIETTPPAPLTHDWTSDRIELMQLIRAASIGEGPGDLQTAVELALSMYELTAQGRMIILTQARVTLPRERPFPIEVRQVGTPGPNAAIASLELWRKWWDPESSAVAYVTVANYAQRPQRVTLTVKQRGQTLTEQRLRLRADQVFQGEIPGIQAEGEIVAKIRPQFDVLREDDERTVASSPAKTSILVVSSQPEEMNPFTRLLQAIPRFEVHWTSPDAPEIEQRLSQADLVTFHRVPWHPVKKPALWLLAMPPDSTGVTQSQLVLWEKSHPLVRYLTAPGNIPVHQAGMSGVPPGFVPVVWAKAKSQVSPLIAVLSGDTRQVFMAGLWDPSVSSFPLSWSILLLNTINWLIATDHPEEVGIDLYQPLMLQVPPVILHEEAQPTPPLKRPERITKLLALALLVLFAVEWTLYWRRQKSEVRLQSDFAFMKR